MGTEGSLAADHVIPFQASLDSFTLPKRFTYPFYYTPHPLVVLAANELQSYLKKQTDWEHNFGLDPKKEGRSVGKMFGVLVVQNPEGQLGYLAAYSGKLTGKNKTTVFVPSIFDGTENDRFIASGMIELGEISKEISELQTQSDFLSAQNLLESESVKAEKEIETKKEENKIAKKARHKKREELAALLDVELQKVDSDKLSAESQRQRSEQKELTNKWKERLASLQQSIDRFVNEVDKLKEKRKNRSVELQQELFDRYLFLNKVGESRSATDIFKKTAQQSPPAATGECAAPKLLQYAFANDLTPVAMGEFWWGECPKSGLRKHTYFYPACRSKCEPVLGFMLQGIAMDENPLIVKADAFKEIETIYEDDALLVIHKPADLLSTPGKTIHDSVLSRMQAKYPKADGPMLVHRLDMATSGLMIIAKSMNVYKDLQEQFASRSIRKRYVAILDGVLEESEGSIDLPIRVDLDDRPRQLVCFEHGKSAQSKWKVVSQTETQTRIHFYPITGRTHQLRVHAAHPQGLNLPIVGDDLYGKKASRLHLHAEWIEFKHPKSGEVMSFEFGAEF